MIKMYISKNEDGHILMAKQKEVTEIETIETINGPIENITNEYLEKNILVDVVKIVFMQTPQGVAPVPCYYPNLLAKDIVKKNFLNKMEVCIPLNEYVIIDEENIVDDMLELYRKEIGKRTGIEIITGPIPHGLKLVK